MYVACDYFQQISTIEMTYFTTYTLNHVAHTYSAYHTHYK